MDCSTVDMIIATASENCLVMVMPVFDVPYQHGCKKQLLGWAEEAAAATFAPLAAHFC